MSLSCVIDPHSTNNVPVVIDKHNRILFQKRLPNDLSTVIATLRPFQQDLQDGCLMRISFADHLLKGVGCKEIYVLSAEAHWCPE